MIIYFLQYIPVAILFYFSRKMDIDNSYRLFSRLLYGFGRFLNASKKTAFLNIKNTFPEFSDHDVNEIIKKMWYNLGGIIGEISHWPKLSNEEFKERVEVIYNTDEIFDLIKNGGIIVSAHYGNWELFGKIFDALEIPNINFLYRKINNPFINQIFLDLRSSYTKSNNRKVIERSQSGIRNSMKALLNKEIITLLSDQYTNSGIDSVFLNNKTKTTYLPAQLALKYKKPIMMSFIQRVDDSSKYKVVFYKLNIKEEDTIESITQKIDDEISYYIKSNPENWFWLHRRWR